jgi:hypothetical protein
MDYVKSKSRIFLADKGYINSEYPMKSILSGAKIALNGTMSSFTNGELKQLFSRLFKAWGKQYAILLGVFALGCIFFAPVVFGLFMLAPGVIIQIFTLLPIWALNWTRAKNPLVLDNIFLDELKVLDNPLASRMRDSIQTKLRERSTDDKRTNRRTKWHWSWLSIALLALGWVPVLGTLFAPILQFIVSAEQLCWNMMSPYTRHYKHMNYEEQRKLYREKRWPLLGFYLPFAAIMSVPVVGPLVIGTAQAASAHLFYRVMWPTEMKKDKVLQGLGPQAGVDSAVKPHEA